MAQGIAVGAAKTIILIDKSGGLQDANRRICLYSLPAFFNVNGQSGCATGLSPDAGLPVRDAQTAGLRVVNGAFAHHKRAVFVVQTAGLCHVSVPLRVACGADRAANR